MIFGLVAALGWGSADYLGALAGRRMGSIATVIAGQVLSAVFMTVVLLATGSSPGRLHAVLGLVALNGICTAIAYGTHYKALELGPVAVVSPIGAAYAVPGIILAMIVLHERPTGVQLAGAAVSLVGVMLVSTDLRALRAGIHDRPAGLPWAIASAFGFGVAAFLLGYVARRAGWIVGLWGSRMAQVACYVPLAAARPREVRRMWRSGRVALALALGAGAADVLGVTGYSYGAEHGFISLVLAASAVFPLIAVALSHRYLHERLVPNQYAGIGLVVAGLLLLGSS